MGLQIFGNLDRNTLPAGLVFSGVNLNQKPSPNFVAGDNISVDIFLTSNDGIQDIQAYTAQRLAIGPVNAKPTGGTYKVDYGGTSNVTLNFDASAQDFADAINTNAPSVPSPVTGTQIAPFTYIIDFGTVGTCSLPTVDSSGLTPSSAVSVQKLVTGDSSTKEQWLVRLFQNPIAFINSDWTNFTDASGNKGIRGSLNLATEGVYDSLDSNESFQSTLELELTDSSGNLQTIFQAPITILADVIGLGSSASAGLPSAIPTSAVTFLNSFPNPNIEGDFSLDGDASFDNDLSINGDLSIAGNTEFQNDLTVANGGIELQDTGLEVTGGGDIEITAGGKLKVGTFVVDSTDGSVSGTQSFTGIVKMPTVRTQLIESSNASTEKILVQAREFRFTDIDGNPDDLLVIKKINSKAGGRVGINTDNNDPKCALHVIENSSDGYPSDEAIRCTGGLRISNWLRLGPYTDSERDAIGLDPPPGLMIYNEEHYEVQVFIANPSGSGRGSWKAFTLQDVAT